MKNIVTVHNKFSNIPPPTSVHFATRVRIPRVFSSDLIFTFVYAGMNIQNASEQFIYNNYLPFLKFVLHPTNKILRI